MRGEVSRPRIRPSGSGLVHFAGPKAGIGTDPAGFPFNPIRNWANAMGGVGTAIGVLFFITVVFAALTSSVSVMEAIVSSAMDGFHMQRKTATIAVTVLAMIAGIVVCLGYNVFYFDLTLPNGSVAQILDVMDYISNYVLMPVVAIASCILIGWVVKPKTILDEITLGGVRFHREKLYVVMVKVVTPIMLLFLLLQSLGVF